jgi:predicted nucleic acid-binding protein
MARDLIIRGMRHSSSILLLQSLAEFSNVATRKLGISAHSLRRRVLAWGDVFPVQAAVKDDIIRALVKSFAITNSHSGTP